MSSSLIQVLVAEDSMAFREGLRDLFGATPDIHLTGDAVNGLEACSLAKRLQPDVILMDLQMPELNGIEATRRILTSSPHIAILVLTMYDDDESIFAAMRAGARGYLLKGALKDIQPSDCEQVGEVLFSNVHCGQQRFSGANRARAGDPGPNRETPH